MPFQTTITQKGQVTIPKQIRDYLKLRPRQKVFVELGEGKKTALIRPSSDFLQIARLIQPKRKINPLLARKKLEREYERS